MYSSYCLFFCSLFSALAYYIADFITFNCQGDEYILWKLLVEWYGHLKTLLSEPRFKGFFHITFLTLCSWLKIIDIAICVWSIKCIYTIICITLIWICPRYHVHRASMQSWRQEIMKLKIFFKTGEKSGILTNLTSLKKVLNLVGRKTK